MKRYVTLCAREQSKNDEWAYHYIDIPLPLTEFNLAYSMHVLRNRFKPDKIYATFGRQMSIDGPIRSVIYPKKKTIVHIGLTEKFSITIAKIMAAIEDENYEIQMSLKGINEIHSGN